MKQTARQQEKSNKNSYAPPAIIYDDTISTRAGSPLGNGDGNGLDSIDLADLFSD